MDLSNITSAELEKLLAEKKKQEKEAYLAKKTDYESYRDSMVKQYTTEAECLNKKLAEFKGRVMNFMEEFGEKARQYGDVKGNSKGGYGLRDTNQNYYMVYEYNSRPEYDERVLLAETLIKEFLEEMVKKANIKTYNTINALMSRNNKGDFSPARISPLLKIKDNYDDPRWVRAMQLFEESSLIRSISNSVSFFKKDENGKDERISLSFPSI